MLAPVALLHSKLSRLAEARPWHGKGAKCEKDVVDAKDVVDTAA